MHIQNAPIAQSMRKSVLWFQAAVLVGASVLPVLLVNSASASTEQLINREARVTNATPGAAFDITFEFDTTAHADGALAVQGAEFEFVDDPLAGYTSAPTNIPTVPAASTVTESGWVTTNEATAFGTYAREDGDNLTVASGVNNQISVQRVDTDNQISNSNNQVSFTGLTHNAAVNTTFYVRVRLYSDTARTTPNLIWEGAVAQSTSQTLNVSARVQERLVFCVGSTTVNDATTSPGADCSAIGGTNVNLGVVDGDDSISPVAALDGGNATNGIAMVNTNAVNGTVISYSALQETSSGKLKVDGQACTDNISTVDGCFNSLTTQGVLTGESFGMTIGGVNCGSLSAPAPYDCVYADGDSNLAPSAGYIGGTYTQNSAGTYGTGTGFQWVDTATYTTIASSSSAPVTKVIDDEALILRFGARASATTPTGTYDVDVDFVATPTF